MHRCPSPPQPPPPFQAARLLGLYSHAPMQPGNQILHILRISSLGCPYNPRLLLLSAAMFPLSTPFLAVCTHFPPPSPCLSPHVPPVFPSPSHRPPPPKPLPFTKMEEGTHRSCSISMALVAPKLLSSKNVRRVVKENKKGHSMARACSTSAQAEGSAVVLQEASASHPRQRESPPPPHHHHHAPSQCRPAPSNRPVLHSTQMRAPRGQGRPQRP